MKRLYYLLTLCISFLCFNSCAIKPLPVEPIVFANKSDRQGLVVGSITFKDHRARYGNYLLKVLSKSTDPHLAKMNTFTINIAPEKIWKVKHVGDKDGGLTYIFVYKKPIGDYEISHFIYSGQNLVYTFLDKITLNNGFTVKRGAITYVGNFYIDEYASKNGITIFERDMQVEDFRFLKNKYPSIDWGN